MEPVFDSQDSPSTHARGLVSTRVIRYLLAFVEEERGGAAAAALLLETPEAADERDRWLPAEQVAQAFRRAATALGDPALPTKVGRRTPRLATSAVVGAVARGLPNVPEAFRNLPRIYRILDRTAEVVVRPISRRNVGVRFKPNVAVPNEIVSFRRGFVAALPVFLGWPEAHVADDPADTAGDALIIRLRARTGVYGPVAGGVAGLLVGGVFAYAVSPAAEVLTLLVTPVFPLLGILGGAVLRLHRQTRTQNRTITDQNQTLQHQLTSLQMSHDALEHVRERLDADVQKRNADLEAERDRLRQLLTLSHELNRTHDLVPLLETAVERVCSILNADLCSVFLLDPESAALVPMAHNHTSLDIPTGAVRAFSAPYDPQDTVFGELMCEALERNRSFFIRDVEKELGRPNLPRYRGRGCMVVLLRSGETQLGVLNIADNRDGQTFSDSEFHLAATIGEHLSTAISNAKMLRQMQILSVTDGLTGLYLHRHFHDVLEREVDRARRYDTPLTLLIMDVDGFKRLNDRYGHLVGDGVLQRVTSVLREELRTNDIPARYGGDELAAILPQTGVEGGVALAERIRKKVALATVSYGDQRLGVTVSIGVCQYRPNMSRAKFIENADQAMYRAKTLGRNRVELHWEDRLVVATGTESAVPPTSPGRDGPT